MAATDWTLDDSLSEDDIRARMAAEAWMPVEPRGQSETTVRAHVELAPAAPLWRMSGSRMAVDEVHLPA